MNIKNNHNAHTSDIVEKFGIQENSLYKILRAHNIKLTKKQRGMSQKTKQIVDYIKDNPDLTEEEIAAYFSIEVQNVSRIKDKYRLYGIGLVFSDFHGCCLSLVIFIAS